MSRESLEELLDRWMNDPPFREAILRDPVGTVEGTGAVLSPTEWAALRAMDERLQKDEQLQARISI
jgi:hypothetical protein